MTVVATGISDTPTEILERILDFLHDDRPALYAASLVRREWVSASRYHLFNQTVIDEYFVPHTEEDLLKENVHSFLALAQSEHCTILHAIRRLILMVMTPALVKEVIDVLVLSQAAPFQIVYIHHTKSASISWSAQTFHNVHDFTFNMEWRAFDNEAWDLITSFPCLRTLAIYTQLDTTITTPPDIFGSAFRNLRTLRLRLLASEELLDGLKDLDESHFAPETFDLRMFRSCHRGWGPVKALNAFLKKISGTLKHLSLGTDIDPHVDHSLLNRGPPIDLRPLVNLTSLFLRTHDMRAVCDSLASLSPSAPLEALTVHVTSWTPDVFNLIRECDCNLTTLFERFAIIMEEKPLIGTKRMVVNIDHGLDPGAMLYVLENCNNGGSTVFSSHWGDHFQHNSLGSIEHVVYTHER